MIKVKKGERSRQCEMYKKYEIFIYLLYKLLYSLLLKIIMTQADYVRIGREHFVEVILPRITAISSQVADNILVFIEGSVAYGYCDQNSDVDIDFFIDMDISDDLRNQITDIFFGETYWRESVRVSYEFGREYWKINHILNNDMDRFWKEFNPYAVNNLAQAIPVWDPKNLLLKIQERVGFYPEDMKKSVIRGLWVTINDSGEYNFEEALKRNNKSEARIYLYRAIEAMLRLTYILNNAYYPPTKWLSKGLQRLENDFGIIKTLTLIDQSDNLHDIYDLFMQVFRNMQQYMRDNNSIEAESIENYPCIFSKQFFIFNTF